MRLGDGPLVLLADHRHAPSALPISAVGDLEDELARLERVRPGVMEGRHG